jgi:voltage-gated potassium channel
VDKQAAAAAARRQADWKRGIKALIQVVVSIVLMGAIYFLLPTDDRGPSSDGPWLLLELVLFSLIVAVQVPAIVRADHPILRAVVALGVVVPLYLLIFARVYLSGSLSSPASFNEPLDHQTALYFTVTVFATVGFGDIVAKTDTMRMLVTAQMLVNLIVVGAGIRILVSAARRGMEQKFGAEPGAGVDDELV